MERKASYTLDTVSFHPRETEVVWTFAFPSDAVFTALDQAARRRGLRPAMASREHGLFIAKPPLSPLNIGRKVVFSLSALSPARTRVKAQYMHGATLFQSRESRAELLDTVLRSALLSLDTALDARIGAAARRQPEPEPQATPRATPRAAPAPEEPPREPAAARQTQPRPEPAAPEAAPRAPERPAPDPAAPAASSAPDLSGLDFGRLDWDDIPLEPPPPEDRHRYGKAAGSRRLSGMAKLLWVLLGMALFFGIALLAGIWGAR